MSSKLKSWASMAASAALFLAVTAAVVAPAAGSLGGVGVSRIVGTVAVGDTSKLTAAGQTSATILARQLEKVNIVLTATTASSTSIVLENRVGSGGAWSIIKSYSTAASVNDTVTNDFGATLFLRLRAATIPAPDTISYQIATVTASRVVQEWFGNNGQSVLKITDQGVVSPQVNATKIVGTADSATGATRAQKLTTARTIGGTSFDGTGNITVNAVSSTSATLAAAATVLATPRAINGVNFDGSAAITVADATKLPLAGGTLVGNLLFTDGLYDIGATGATRPRNAFLSGNATVGGSFTGTYAALSAAGAATGVTQNARFSNTTTAMANGQGVSFDFLLTDSAAVAKQTGQIASVWSNYGVLHDIADLVFYTRQDGGTIAEAMRVSGTGVLSLTGPAKLRGYTVAALPAGVQGYVAFATDLVAPTFMATAVGGGTVVGVVFYNGTAWVSF